MWVADLTYEATLRGSVRVTFIPSNTFLSSHLNRHRAAFRASGENIARCSRKYAKVTALVSGEAGVVISTILRSGSGMNSGVHPENTIRAEIDHSLG